MSTKKEIVHYNIDEITKRNADINIIWGERSNGKSYQVKHKKAVENYLNSIKINPNKPHRFMLIRRFREEIKKHLIEQYFADVDTYKLTDGKYNCITYYSGKLYFGWYDNDTAKIKRGEHIGYVAALSSEQHYAGTSMLDVYDIIFEEFMSRGLYLGKYEPDKLMNLYCTIDRKRHVVKLWLVGNTISRVCPYLTQWNLQNIISRQKQGTIEELEIPSTDDDVVKIAIEYCKSTGVSSHTIGTNKDMLNSGSWQVTPQPKLSKSIKEFKTLYKIAFCYQGFKFIGKLIQDIEDKNICWFIQPYEGDFTDDIIIFSDIIKTDRNYQRNIYDITIKNEKLKNIFSTFREGNIFYASDLCGTDFKQVIDFSIRR